MNGRRAWWRRLTMGLQTVSGLRLLGFFSPYRYAETVKQPNAYPALEVTFRAAEPRFNQLLDQISENAEVLAALDGPAPLPRWQQSWFPRLDGAAAYSLVRQNCPKRLIEVGSGHSTRFLAAAVEANGQGAITCIDPEPRAALKGLPVDWQCRVLSDVDIDAFAHLKAGDVAFFDSSHLLWPGTDVDLLLNGIMPVLKPGVLLHIHDILLPDPYPEEWAWRGYTEQLGLGGWLIGGAYELVFSSHYAVTRMGAVNRSEIAQLGLPRGARETSLWLRRV